MNDWLPLIEMNRSSPLPVCLYPQSVDDQVSQWTSDIISCGQSGVCCCSHVPFEKDCGDDLTGNVCSFKHI